MKKRLLLIIKGFIIGVANIVPGVSGGTLAITMGLYEDIIGAVNHFFSNFKKNLQLLIPIGLGVVFAILLGSRLLEYSFTNYPVATTLLFAGLVTGGIPFLFRKASFKKADKFDISIFLIAFALVIVMYFTGESDKDVTLTGLNIFGHLKLFILGIIGAATIVIPGISGSLLLMILGYYNPILETINNITKFNNVLDNILVLFPFGVGMVLGVLLVARLIEFLFKKHDRKTYFGILGFVISSVLVVILPLFKVDTTTSEVVIGIVLFVIGCVIANKLEGEE